jgi:hypothetical protein
MVPITCLGLEVTNISGLGSHHGRSGAGQIAGAREAMFIGWWHDDDDDGLVLDQTVKVVISPKNIFELRPDGKFPIPSAFRGSSAAGTGPL